MDHDDVHGDDMPDPSLSAEELAAILEGRAPDLADHPVARFVARSRDALAAESGPPPSGELAALMADQAVTAPAPPPESAAEVIDLTATPDPHPRRIPVFAALTSFLGTLGGKVAVGTVAAASVAGAHAAGVVDVPLLPDDDPSVVEIEDHDEESDDSIVDSDEADDHDADDDSDEADDHDADDESDDDSDDHESDDHDADDESDDESDDHDADHESDDHDADDESDDHDADDHESDDHESDDHESDDDESDDDSATSTTTSTLPVAIADQTLSYTVAGVGTTTVQVRGGVLSLVSAVPAAGWILDEAGMDGLEAESEYVQGTIEVDIDIQIDNGLLRVRVRERDDATDSDTEFFEYFDADGNSLGDLGRNG